MCSGFSVFLCKFLFRSFGGFRAPTDSGVPDKDLRLEIRATSEDNDVIDFDLRNTARRSLQTPTEHGDADSSIKEIALYHRPTLNES